MYIPLTYNGGLEGEACGGGVLALSVNCNVSCYCRDLNTNVGLEDENGSWDMKLTAYLWQEKC